MATSIVTGALSLGVKRPGHEADHSPPSSAEVKNAWNYTSTAPVRLHDVVLSYSTRTILPLPFYTSMVITQIREVIVDKFNVVEILKKLTHRLNH
jgi:hypothetical protein